MPARSALIELRTRRQRNAAAYRRAEPDRNCYVSAYPNAGLPNAIGESTTSALEDTGHYLEDWAREGFKNIVGGCCSTTLIISAYRQNM